MFVPSTRKLKGLSLQVADLYGKPHIGAFYAGKTAQSHRMGDDAHCPICGKSATNVHHVAPLSKGHRFILETGNGQWALKTALFALCGSGTTGCHDGFHGGARYWAEWVWHSDANAEAWWEGEVLKRVRPHDPMLYAFGHWRIHDKLTGAVIEIRGVDDTEAAPCLR